MKFFLILMMSLATSVCYAKTLKTSQLKTDQINLKNFGFTYCLSNSKDHSLSSESSLAMGGYFQNGNYEEPAYKNIKSFVEKYNQSKTDVYQSTGNSAVLMNCLDMYNDSEYQKNIQSLEQYLIK